MKSHLVLFVLFLLLVLLVFSYERTMASNQSPKDVMSLLPERVATQKEDLVTKLNAHALICSVAEEYGMMVIRSDPGPKGFRPVKKNDRPIESVSIVLKSNNLERWGPRFTLMKNEEAVGILQIGVFSDPNLASKTLTDHLLHTSMGPNKDLTTELGDKSMGWLDERYKGFRRILFIRDNTVVSVSLFLERFVEIGGKAITTMEIAKEIDNALAQGTLGVQRGTVLKVPHIVSVETPTKIRARTQIEAKVRIAVAENPQDPNSKEVEIVRTVPFHVPSVDAPDNKLTYEVTYITAGCVVTSQHVTLTIAPISSVPASGTSN